MDFNLAVTLRESARRVPGKAAVILGETGSAMPSSTGCRTGWPRTWRRAVSQPGDRVGLQLPNIPQFVIAYFGILKAGGVVVPMNVLLKAPEIEFQLRDSGAAALITFGGVLDEAAKAAEAAAVRTLYVAGPAALAAPARPFDELVAGDPPGPQLAPVSPAVPGRHHLHLRHDRHAEGSRAVALHAVHERRHLRAAVRVR